MTLDQREIRNGFGRFATGVTVVTCENDAGEPHGATVNAFTAVSLEPALCQVTLTRRSKACGYLDGAPFAVNVLAAEQQDIAWHFAGKPQEPGPLWAQGPTAPVLLGNAATISCRPWRTYDGGDHLIVLGEVVDLQLTDAEPLLFFAGRFRSLRALDSGHHWAASVDCPESSWFGMPAAGAYQRVPA
ncbi:flavin reductase [Prauserella sp. PE36]|uniref:Flavin reductase family protein n=1 Tax=Prauserella endophytica TaxID=1592324 RepID=A0ABY2S5L9_9PSEU|nr:MULTISPECIES: flavin reductase family protein [Prauserella]PXY29958.1 flavin reductase [Prauserella coralliicola]RBM12363.1 flavin reductase [Prauserella sp. PE36]TKG71013.1 flavin reductase family protein [Prauserella endophytica]